MRRWRVPAWAGAILAATNVVNNRALADRERAYVVSCLGAAGFLVALARVDGCTWAELGLTCSRLGRGARVGAAAAAAAAAALAVSAGTRTGRTAFHDDRAVRRGRAGAWRAALVRVPFGTVALEEIAFRSVVPALLAPRIGRRRAVNAAIGLFGAWHVLPSIDLANANEAMRKVVSDSRPASVALGTASMTGAGAVLWWLRVRADSVVASALPHWAANATGYILAARSGRERRPGRDPRRRRRRSRPPALH